MDSRLRGNDVFIVLALERHPREGVKNATGILDSKLFETYATLTGIPFNDSILADHSFGPVWCTEVPVESTATVTGMSCTSNS